MTISEFSDQFDVLYNNITSNQAPGLNEYEKSVFLTKAAKEIVKNYFTANSKGNTIGQGFDDSAKRQADFSCLMKTESCELSLPPELLTNQIYSFTYDNFNPTVTVDGSSTVYAVIISGNNKIADPVNNPVQERAYVIDVTTVNVAENTFEASSGGITLKFYGLLSRIPYTTQGTGSNTITIASKTISSPVEDRIDPRSGVWTFPEDVFIIINEAAYTSTGKILQVIPLRYDEYTRLMSKPFKYPLKNQAWRLINAGNVSGGIVSTKYTEIISNLWDSIQQYRVRYIRTPKPIIIAPLGNLTIDNESGTSDCELDPILHEEILQRAVELAKIAWAGEPAATVQAGQRSE